MGLTKHNNMPRYVNTPFNQNQLPQYFDELPLWSAPFGLKLLDAVDYKPNLTALDIGFGTGFPLTELAMRLGNSCTVYGIDPWKEAVERAQQKVDFYGIHNVTLIEGVAENIPLNNQSIDLITSNNGINNVLDIGKVFSECARIMKPGGQFIQTMNTELTMFEFYNTFETVLAELNLTAEIAALKAHIAKKRPPVSHISTLLTQHGFRVKTIEQHQFNYKFANGTALFNHYFIRLAFLETWIKLVPADKIEQIFTNIEERLNQQAFDNGGLTLSVPFVVINALA